MKKNHYRLLRACLRVSRVHVEGEAILIALYPSGEVCLRASITKVRRAAYAIPARWGCRGLPAQVGQWRCGKGNSAKPQKVTIHDSLHRTGLRHRNRRCALDIHGVGLVPGLTVRVRHLNSEGHA